MKRLLPIWLSLAASLIFVSAIASQPKQAFKGTFVNKEFRINLVIDLNAEAYVKSLAEGTAID